MKLTNSYHVLLVMFFGVFLSACVDFIPSDYSVKFPIQEASYVGTVDNPAPVSDGTTTQLEGFFVIDYKTPPSSSPDIVLNGQNISEYFVFGPASAQGEVTSFEHLLRQGKNTLSVDALNFGPVNTFYLDSKGPDIVIYKGDVTGGNSVDIEGLVRDISGVGSVLELDLIQIVGYKSNGKVKRQFVETIDIAVNQDGVFSAAVDITGLVIPEVWIPNPSGNVFDPDILDPDEPSPVSLLYSFRSVDEYGYRDEVEYLGDDDGAGDGLPIRDSVRVAVGETFVQSLRPVIAAALKTSMEENPIDIGIDCVTCDTDTQAGLDSQAMLANSFNVNVGLGNMPTRIKRVFMNNVEVAGKQMGAVSLYDFRVIANDNLGLGMAIAGMEIRMHISFTGFLGFLMRSGLPMEMYIGKTIIESEVELRASNGKVNLQLRNADILLEDLIIEDVSIFGINIAAIAQAMLPVIQGFIEDMIPGIINPILKETMQEIVIGSTMYRTDLLPESVAGAPTYDRLNLPKSDAEGTEDILILDAIKDVPHVDVEINVANIGTDSLISGVYDLMLGMNTKADIAIADASVSPVLGTLFNDDPIPLAEVFNGFSGSNLSVAVNSNFINQILASQYALGTMHLTQYKGTTYVGAHPLTPCYSFECNATRATTKGDSRIRLWPDTPPFFSLGYVDDDVTAAKATVVYPSAMLAVDTLNGAGEWELQYEIKLDFNVGLIIKQEDQAVSFAAAGPPEFNVNSVINHTNIQFPNSWVQGILDTAMFFGGDALSDKVVFLDLAAIAAQYIKGERLVYNSVNDEFTLATDECALRNLDDTWQVCKIDPTGACGSIVVKGDSADGKNDVICELMDFQMSTETVGAIGAEGTNLFFQMTIKDPDTPNPPVIPKLDLDDDGIIDYIDNCAVNPVLLNQAIEAVQNNVSYLGKAEGKSILSDPFYMDQDTGEPTTDFEALILVQANIVVAEIAIANGAKPNDNTVTPNPYSDGSISQVDEDWYNYLRKTDNPITVVGSGNWVKMMFSNRSQYNYDGDRVGEMCEDDNDRDGMYTDNIPASVDRDNPDEIKYWIDNCPTIQQLRPNGDYYTVGESAYFLETETDSRTTAGDACDVRKNFVMIRSLGGRELANGVDACLAHNFTKAENLGYIHGSNNPDVLLSISGYPILNGNGLGRIGGVMACDPNDVRQQWYFHPNTEVNPTAYNIYTHPYVNHSYRRDIADDPDHPQRHVKIAAYEEGFTGVGAMNLINREVTGDGRVNLRTEHDGERENYSYFDFSITGVSRTGSTLQEARHPWLIGLASTSTPSPGVECMFFGNYLGDFDPAKCREAFTYTNSSETLTYSVNGGNDWRWGILVGPEMEPWNDEWCIPGKC